MREERLANLVVKGGNDAHLLLLDLIEAVEDRQDPEKLAKGDKGEPGPRGPAGKDGKEGKQGPPGAPGRNGRDGLGIQGVPGKDGKDGKPGKDGSPDTAEQILKKLKGKLKISHVDKLREELDALKKKQSESQHTIIASARGAVKYWDLSSFLDGVTKTFALPAFYRVISVHSSSFPNILRPDVDYTTDGTLMKITFTNEITADTTLASGQTLLIVYAEP